MEKIILQNRKNPERIMEVTAEQYEKLKELGHSKAWQVVNTVQSLDKNIKKEVETMIAESKVKAEQHKKTKVKPKIKDDEK